MSIKTKNAGAYADIVGVFHKRAGAYEAVQGVYAKAGGVYSRVDAPAFPPKEFYFTDFAGVANGTTLRSLPGWGAYNSTSSTDAQRDTLVIQSERIVKTGGVNFTTLPGLFVIGRDAGGADHVIRVRLATTATAELAIALVVGATNEQNAITFHVNAGASSNFIISKNVAGTSTDLWVQATSNSTIARSLQAGDELELMTLGDYVHTFVNGIRITPTAGVSISGFTKGNVCGFGIFNISANSAAVDDVYVAQLSATVAVADTQVFWPGVVGSGRTFAASGTYVGSVLALDSRIINAVTGAEVATWTRMSGATIGSGAWSGNVTAPMGDITTNPRFRLEVRAANDTDAAGNSNAFAVGLGVVSYGQSNSQFRDSSTSGAPYALTNFAYTATVSGSDSWFAFSGASGGIRAAAKASDVMAGLLGVPVGVVIGGEGSQTIDSLISTYYTPMQTRLDSLGIRGRVCAWLWTQGEAESEATSPAVFDPDDYRTKFTTLIGMMRADSVAADVPVGVVVIGRRNTTPSTAPDIRWSAVRACLHQLDDISGVSLAHNIIGLPMVDEFHLTGAGYTEANRRAALGLAKVLGSGGYDGRGPIITGATRSGATITLAVDLNGASSISGTGLTNYEVSTDDFATTKTISSAAVSGGNIVITLSADPGAAVKVRSFYGINWGASPTFAIGTYADATTIPVEPLFVPVTSN